MALPDARRRLALSVFVLAGMLVGLPWATGGRSAAGQAGLVLLLGLAGGVGLFPRNLDPPLRLSPPLLFGFILVGSSALNTIYPDRTVQTLLLLFAYALASPIAARAVAQIPWAGRAFLNAIWISGIVVTIPAMIWLHHGIDGGVYANALIGPFGYPNAMGGFLLLSGGAALATLLPDRSRPERSMAFAGCVLSSAGIYLTRSRGILLAAGVGLLVWALVRHDRWWPQRSAWRVLAAMILLGGTALLASRLAGIVAALWPGSGGSIGDTSTAWRLHILDWTLSMIRDHPVFGVGPGAFPVALTHYQRIPYVSGVNPHNLYLEVAAEYGLVAGILVAAGLIFLLIRAVVTARRLPESEPRRGRLAALSGTAVAFAFHSAFDLDWSYPAIAVAFVTILGMVWASLVQSPVAGPRKIGIPLPRTLLILALLIAGAAATTRYYAASLTTWGQSELAAGDLSSAVQSLDLSLRLNPLSYASYRWLAWATLRSGDIQRAIEVAERTVRIAPQDPNGNALTGEIALAGSSWRIAQTAFRRAVDQAPMAHLRYHAGLLEAASKAGEQSEAIRAYKRALSAFTPDRVLHPEARCLAPGDRYLLGRMSRTAAHLYDGIGDSSAQKAAADLAGILSQPDPRGICTTGGRPGHTSPESAVASFWLARSEGGNSAAGEYVLEHSSSDAVGGQPLAHLLSIYSLDGGERRATVWHEVEIDDGRTRINRCARAATQFTSKGWFLEDIPSVGNEPCRPQG